MQFGKRTSPKETSLGLMDDRSLVGHETIMLVPLLLRKGPALPVPSSSPKFLGQASKGLY